MSKKKTRPFVTSVHSNLKSPCPVASAWDIELGQHTLLVGTNASHKSSVIQSVELALSGSADDVVGRQAVRDPDLLLSLCPQNKQTPGQKNLHASVTLSNDSRGTLAIERINGSNKKPNHVGPGNQVLVHRAVKSALSGSVASRRKAFLGWIGSDFSREEMFSLIPAGLHSRFNDLFDHLGHGKDTIEALISISDYSAKQSRDLAKQRRGAEAVVNEVIDAHTDTAPSDEDVEKMEQAVEEARNMLEQAAACAHGMTESARQGELILIEQNLKVLDAKIEQGAAEVEALKSKTAATPDYLTSGYDSLGWALTEEIEQCPTCSSQVGAAHLKSCHTFFGGQINQIEQSNKEIVSVIEGLETTLLNERRDRQDLLDRLTTVANTPSRTDAGISLEDARDRLNAASLALNSTMILKSKWDQVIASRQLLKDLERDASNYSEIKGVCDSAMTEILRLQSDRFVSVVQTHLPDDWQFRIVLYDQHTNSPTFSMGLVHNDELHEALSGAEWATVTTALAMAVAQLNLSTDEPAILIPEDRAWDGKTLSSVMRSFRNFNGQVIMASTIRPTGRAPAGWTIIDMDKVSASWLSSEEEEVAEEEVEVVEEVVEEVAPEVRKDDTIRRPKAKAPVATASATAIGMMGFTSEQIDMMSKKTAADIIKKRLTPEDILVDVDGGYSLTTGVKALNLPPAPSR